jgi:phage gp45-like
MKKILLLMVFATLSWQQALGQAFTSDGLNYNVTSPTTCSVGNQNTAATGAVVIPTQVTYDSTVYSVTSISNFAFEFCSGLTSVTIPNSVTSIDGWAFSFCSGLTSVTIGNSVTSIGGQAFYNCTGLTSLTIGNSVTSIGGQAFYNCTGLTSLTIPNSVTSIGDSAFYNCSGLTSLTIGNSVTSIGGWAFYLCSGLPSLTIPNSVTSIGAYAFCFCSGLTSLTIGNSVTSIGGWAFYLCSGLPSLTIPNSVTSIGGQAFYNCTGLTSLTIGNSVTSIGDQAFSCCAGLTSVIIPNSVTSIGNLTFENCFGLTSVTIPNSVTSIGDFAFTICSGLTSVTIPNSVTSIGGSAFSGCSGLTSLICNITTPLTIDSNVFQGVTQSTCSLTVPPASIGAYQGAAVWQNFMIQNNIPTTKIKTNLCGATLSSLSANINADYIAGYQQYRFEVTNGATVNVVEVNKYNFSLTQTPGITYSTTYGVRVAVKMGGTWGAYGVSCNVTTPTLTSNVIPTTTIMPSFCGTTLVALDTKIGATLVYNATGYRFEITKGGVTTIYDSAVYNFRLAQAGLAAYGTTYAIRVAALVNGVYGTYGASCTVATPVLSSNTVPLTKVGSAFCNTTLAALDTKIGADVVASATGYRFEIIKGGTTTVYNSLTYNFRLSQTGVVVAYGTTYTIRAAALVSGFYGNYGASCTVTTPPAPARMKAKTFEVSAYPNPFETAFSVNLETPSKEYVTITVYDMMGKLVESHQLNPTEVANLQIGNNFAAGIYNVIVSQANEMQAIRLIRK